MLLKAYCVAKIVKFGNSLVRPTIKAEEGEYCGRSNLLKSTDLQAVGSRGTRPKHHWEAQGSALFVCSVVGLLSLIHDYYYKIEIP